MNPLAKDWMPPVLLRWLRYLSSNVRFQLHADKTILKSNLTLKGTGAGRRAFLIATGPSLKQEDLSVLAGEDCFTLSNFFLHDELEAVSPKFHFFAPYHEPLVLENYIEWLRAADLKLPVSTGIVLGHSDQPLVKEFDLFPARDIHYLYLSEVPSRSTVDLARPVLAPQTGTIMMLPVLFYMGYSEIYLLGCDHTVLRDYGKRVSNFYPEDQDPRVNATTGDCWHDIVRSHQYSLNIFKQYEFYKRYVDKYNLQVWNLSCDTWLDVFPLKKLEDLSLNEMKGKRAE